VTGDRFSESPTRGAPLLLDGLRTGFPRPASHANLARERATWDDFRWVLGWKGTEKVYVRNTFRRKRLIPCQFTVHEIDGGWARLTRLPVGSARGANNQQMRTRSFTPARRTPGIITAGQPRARRYGSSLAFQEAPQRFSVPIAIVTDAI
jgi:hypothetical protein